MWFNATSAPLELGGKNALIAYPDADPDEVAGATTDPRTHGSPPAFSSSRPFLPI
jgi:hypothetical protein